jgi:cation-transporting ATPase F
MVVLQVALTYWSPMNHLFDTAPIDAGTWLKVLAAAAVTWMIVETEKAIRRRTAGHRLRRGSSIEPAHREA